MKSPDPIGHALQLHREGRVDEAYELASGAPPSVERSRLLVTILVGRQNAADIDAAQRLVRNWLRSQPRSPEPWIRQLEIHLFNKRLQQARKALTEIRKRAPGAAQTRFYEALLLQLAGDWSRALEAYRKSILIQHRATQAKSLPSDAVVNAMAAHRVCRVAMGWYPGSRSSSHLRLLNRPAERELLQSSLERLENELRQTGKPATPDVRQFLARAWHDLGLALIGTGQGVESFQNALRWRDDHESARRNGLLALNYSASMTDEEVFQRHCENGRWFQQRYPQANRAFANAKDPDRPLRVAYLSADFRLHPVAHFILPVLEHHDPERVQSYVYHNHAKEDGFTQLARDRAHSFRNVSKLDHDQLAAQLIADQIDILVDLNGYTGQSRIPLLARRAAPVQISWIGYPNTTGLDTVDYRIVDGVTDPIGPADEFNTERLIRMPEVFSVYAPLEEMPPVVPAPCLDGDDVTFGSFNNLAKINTPVLECWAEILSRVPASRLVIKDFAMDYEAVRRGILRFFAARGIDDQRIRFKGHIEDRFELFKFYSTVDICLDTFPYNGTTTTCESLYMGVPVVTCRGESHRARVTASQLGAMGLDSLVGRNSEEYAKIAAGLASDRALLEKTRNGLRERMQSSPLMDAAGFTLELESRFREVFARWCKASNL